MIREGEEGQGWDEATSAAATFVNQPVFDPKVSNRVADRSWCYICEVTSFSPKSFKLARLGWREKLRHLWNNQKSQTALQRQELLHLWILFEIRSTCVNVNNWVWRKSKLVKPELWPWIEHLKRVSRLRTQKHLKRVSREAKRQMEPNFCEVWSVRTSGLLRRISNVKSQWENDRTLWIV